MPAIPTGAKKPDDHKPSASAIIKPEEHPDGWDLLRPAIALEEWESAELYANVLELSNATRVRSNISSAILRLHGQTTRTLQEKIAVDPDAFREWIRAVPQAERLQKILDLALAYVQTLGEADSSAS